MKETILSLLESGDTLLSPVLGVISVATLCSLLLVLSRKTRRFSGWAFYTCSFVFGMKAWLMGASITLSLWGWIGLLIGVLIVGVGVIPMAIVATFVSGDKDLTMVVVLITLVVITWLLRLIGLMIIAKSER